MGCSGRLGQHVLTTTCVQVQRLNGKHDDDDDDLDDEEGEEEEAAIGGGDAYGDGDGDPCPNCGRQYRCSAASGFATAASGFATGCRAL